MAANFILKQTLSFLDFVQEGFRYNLQVLPDVILSAATLFAVLFQSPPMATFAAGLLTVTFAHGKLAEFLQAVIPGLVGISNDSQKCSGRFPGVSYEGLLGLASLGSMGTSAATWPSYYSTFVGFLAGWIGSLPAIYATEIAASPQRAASITGGLITLALLCAVVMVYRIASACESFASISVGLFAGFLIGLGLVLIVAWLSDRRLTNMLGMPLIRDKAEDGKPIYVCERNGSSENAAL